MDVVQNLFINNKNHQKILKIMINMVLVLMVMLIEFYILLMIQNNLN